jgi:hypothetical protein
MNPLDAFVTIPTASVAGAISGAMLGLLGMFAGLFIGAAVGVATCLGSAALSHVLPEASGGDQEEKSRFHELGPLLAILLSVLTPAAAISLTLIAVWLLARVLAA